MSVPWASVRMAVRSSGASHLSRLHHKLADHWLRCVGGRDTPWLVEDKTASHLGEEGTCHQHTRTGHLKQKMKGGVWLEQKAVHIKEASIRYER